MTDVAIGSLPEGSSAPPGREKVRENSGRGSKDTHSQPNFVDFVRSSVRLVSLMSVIYYLFLVETLVSVSVRAVCNNLLRSFIQADGISGARIFGKPLIGHGSGPSKLTLDPGGKRYITLYMGVV